MGGGNGVDRAERGGSAGAARSAGFLRRSTRSWSRPTPRSPPAAAPRPRRRSRPASRPRAIPTPTSTAFSAPDHPKDGGLVAVLKGSDPKRKPLLLLAHLDVVEAKREDWARDPFKLVEEGGYYYARGAIDDKAMAAVWADTMIRLKAGKPPKRTVKMALTCGEETTFAWNGAEWLSTNRKDLIDAEFALNEGGGGRTEADGTAPAARGPGRREGGAELHLHRHQSRRAQLGPAPRQRDLRAGRRREGGAGLRLSRPLHRHHPRLLHRHRPHPAAPRWALRSCALLAEPERQGRRRDRQPRPHATFDAAHHLRRHIAQRRSRRERAAPARHRQRQLPHLPRRHGRGGRAPSSRSLPAPR